MKGIKTILIGVLITAIIAFLASKYGKSIDVDINLLPPSFGPHTIMLFLSVLAIYFLKNTVIYKIELPQFKTLLKPIGLGLLVSVLSAIVMSVTMIVTGGSNSTEMKIPASNLSVLQVILFVFIYASFAEEILFRGFLLNYLSQLKTKGISILKRKVSVPVVISAVLFGLFHILPFKSEDGVIFTIGMLIAPTLLGVVAGYYQEKHNNNAYAIAVHMSGNLMGIIGSVVMNTSG